MGMYTELVLKCSIVDDAPQIVKDVVLHLFDGGELPDSLPEHDFFKCHRWEMIGRGSSYYHHPEEVNSVPKSSVTDTIYIFSRSDLKNYDDEISKFVDWLTPYIEAYGDTCIGWSWYEENEKPTLIMINKG